MDGYSQNKNSHIYTDDVALCYANSLENAIEIFSKLYNKKDVIGNVKETIFNDFGIFICTDY